MVERTLVLSIVHDKVFKNTSYDPCLENHVNS